MVHIHQPCNAPFEKYGWWFCGTIVPTKKHAGKDDDIPFINYQVEHWDEFPLVGIVKQLWHKEYYVQTTMWKECKQVMFLHTVNIESSRGIHTIRRSKRVRSGRDVFPALLAQLDYSENYAAVD